VIEEDDDADARGGKQVGRKPITFTSVSIKPKDERQGSTDASFTSSSSSASGDAQDAAVALRTTVDDLVLRLEEAGFCDLVTTALREQAAREQRRSGR